MNKKASKDIREAIIDFRNHGGRYPINFILRMHTDQVYANFLIRTMESMGLIESKSSTDRYDFSLTPNGWNYKRKWHEDYPVFYDVLKILIVAILSGCISLWVGLQIAQQKAQEQKQKDKEQDGRLDMYRDSIRTLQRLCK